MLFAMHENHLDFVLDRKIQRLEKWIERLEKELQFLKQVTYLNNESKSAKMMQAELFRRSG